MISKSQKIEGRPSNTKKTYRKFGNDITNIVNQQYASKEDFMENLSSIEFFSKNTLCLNHKSATKSVLLISDQQTTKPSSRKSSIESKYSKKNSIINNKAISYIDTNSVPPIDQYRQQISNYIVDQSYLYRITQDYMEWQTEIDSLMRQSLVNEIINAHYSLGLSQQTLFLTIYLIDRYCYLKNIIKKKYMLLGATCLYLAAKFHEKYIPKLSKYMALCNNVYTQNQYFEMEGQILNTLMFEINQVILPRQILQMRVEQLYYNKILIENRSILTRNCEYLLELCLIDYDFCRKKPHYLSAVIIFYAIKLMQAGQATISQNKIRSKHLIQLYGLSETIFKTYFGEVMSLFKTRKQPKFSSINRKYGIKFQ